MLFKNFKDPSLATWRIPETNSMFAPCTWLRVGRSQGLVCSRSPFEHQSRSLISQACAIELSPFQAKEFCGRFLWRTSLKMGDPSNVGITLRRRPCRCIAHFCSKTSPDGNELLKATGSTAMQQPDKGALGVTCPRNLT